MIYIGSDHRGFESKNNLKQYLLDKGYEVEDLGPAQYDPADDFVDFAIRVAEMVSKNSDNRGILLCRNGVGMDIVANKFNGIRASLGFNVEQVRLARNDDNINVMSLANDFLDQALMQDITKTFLDTPFEGHERQTRRLGKIKQLEK